MFMRRHGVKPRLTQRLLSLRSYSNQPDHEPTTRAATTNCQAHPRTTPDKYIGNHTTGSNARPPCLCPCATVRTMELDLCHNASVSCKTCHQTKTTRYSQHQNKMIMYAYMSIKWSCMRTHVWVFLPTAWFLPLWPCLWAPALLWVEPLPGG